MKRRESVSPKKIEILLLLFKDGLTHYLIGGFSLRSSESHFWGIILFLFAHVKGKIFIILVEYTPQLAGGNLVLGFQGGVQRPLVSCGVNAP